jgi:polysaccharide biosynthesis protein PslF
MRICIVSPNFPPMPWPCGAADFVEQFARRLADVGQHATVVTSNPKADRNGLPFEVQVIPGNWGLRHMRKVASWMARAGSDVVDVQFEAAMYGSRWPVMLLPQLVKRHDAPWVITLHSQALPSWGGRWWRPVQLLSYDAAVFYGESFQHNMQRRFPRRKDRFLLQPFPSNIGRITSPLLAAFIAKMKSAVLGDQSLLVYFGLIAPKRGIETLLAALLELKANGHRPQLVLISKFDPVENTYHRELLCSVEQMRLDSQVSFTGSLDNDGVSRLLQAADVCVLPFPDGASFKNGSLAAAIEHAVPTVTTATSLTDPELLSCHGLRTYAPGDVHALAVLLEELVLSSAACEQARVRMQELHKLLSWQSYIEKRLIIYQLASSGKKAGSTVQYSYVENS